MDKPVFRFEMDIPESALRVFEAKCNAIADRVFSERLAALQKERVKFTRAEAALRLRVSLPTLDKYIAEGVIKSQRMGKRILIPEAELENFLNRNR